MCNSEDKLVYCLEPQPKPLLIANGGDYVSDGDGNYSVWPGTGGLNKASISLYLLVLYGVYSFYKPYGRR